LIQFLQTMKRIISLSNLVFFFLFCFTSASRRQFPQEFPAVAEDVKYCKGDEKEGAICTIKPEDLKPTQFAFGSEEVECKKKYLESLSKSELESYLSDEKRWIIVVIGPEGFFVVDGHHLTRAVMDADVDKDLKVMHSKILQNWKSYTTEEFWERMVDFNYVWLQDEKGIGPISPDHLPRNIAEMKNDPFRTLSWAVSDAGGFAKIGVPFEDFLWGDFFRANIPLSEISTPLVHYIKVSDHEDHDGVSNGNRFNLYQMSQWNWCEVRPYCNSCFPNEKKVLEEVLPIAIKLANSPAASHLPGYKMGVLDPPKCG